jgi:hypothetical protein
LSALGKKERAVVVSSSITINSNLASLNAQRRLGQSTSALQTSFTRLSSGLRINKASDDAVGTQPIQLGEWYDVLYDDLAAGTIHQDLTY